MQRREVLKFGALAMLAGPSAFAAARHERADVIVIGSGGAGMTAAITAFDAKVRVVVLEKMPITGGNTQLAAGGMNAAETVFQKKKSIQDSVNIMIDDTFKGGKGIATTVGALAVWGLLPTLIAGLVAIAIIALSKYVSLGSLVLAVLLPILFAIFGADGPFIWGAAFVGAIAISTVSISTSSTFETAIRLAEVS